MRSSALALVFLLALPGCEAIERTLERHRLIHSIVPEHAGRAVKVQSRPTTLGSVSAKKITLGTAAVISEDTLITAAHVARASEGRPLDVMYVDPTGRGRCWLPARVVRYVDGPVEPIAVLVAELAPPDQLLGFHGWPVEDRYVIGGSGAAPHAVETRRGPYRWTVGRIRPGDSGSPVVDSAGRLVGLAWGTYGPHPVFLPVFARDF